MEVAERRQPLRASEKPLRATGSGQKAASGEPGSIDPGAGENGQRGAERRIVRRFCSRCSMPCMPVVSQCWKSGHLEPFLFVDRPEIPRFCAFPKPGNAGAPPGYQGSLIFVI